MGYAIGIDFDGVIHKYSKGWHDGTIYDLPVDGAKKAILKLMEEYSVFVHTTRNPLQVVDWMSNFLFPTDVFSDICGTPVVIPDSATTADLEFWNSQTEILVTNRKFPALAYIDDRAIHFTNWNKALRALEHFKKTGHLPSMLDTIYCDYAHSEDEVI